MNPKVKINDQRYYGVYRGNGLSGAQGKQGIQMKRSGSYEILHGPYGYDLSFISNKQHNGRRLLVVIML